MYSWQICAEVHQGPRHDGTFDIFSLSPSLTLGANGLMEENIHPVFKGRGTETHVQSERKGENEREHSLSFHLLYTGTVQLNHREPPLLPYMSYQQPKGERISRSLSSPSVQLSAEPSGWQPLAQRSWFTTDSALR